MLDQAGSDDKHVVDPDAAERGRKVYIAQCITCHGSTARGAQNGPDLVRSLTLLHDRYGSVIGPYLKKGHPTQSTPSADLTDAQVKDLSHFLHARLETPCGPHPPSTRRTSSPATLRQARLISTALANAQPAIPSLAI